jgi:SAF domain.
VNKSKRIAISLIAGVLAALLCMVYASSIRSQAEQVQAETLAKYGGDRVEVCVAARDIDVGETLDETNVITQEWLASLLPRDAATELRQVRGDVTTSRIPKNAVICDVYTKAETTRSRCLRARSPFRWRSMPSIRSAAPRAWAATWTCTCKRTA